MTLGTERKRWLIVLLALLLFAFLLFRIDSVIGVFNKLMAILSPFIVGTFMALLMNLPMKWLEKHLPFFGSTPFLRRFKRALCLGLAVLLVLALFSFLMVVIVPEIVAAVQNLIAAVPNLLKQLEEWLTTQNTTLRQLFGLAQTDETAVRQQFQNAYNFLLGGINYSPNVVLSAAQLLVNVIIGLVFAIYLLFSKERIRRQVYSVAEAYLPPARSAGFKRVAQLTISTFSSFLGGQCLQALISALVTWVAMRVFGMPYAVLVSLVVFVTAFIPILGPFIAGFMGALLVLTVDPSKALWFLLLFFAVQQLEGSLVYPRIMASAIDMPSIWVLVAVTLGGGIMGIAGMLIFIPAAAVLYNLLSASTAARLRQRQGTAPEDSGG